MEGMFSDLFSDLLSDPSRDSPALCGELLRHAMLQPGAVRAGCLIHA